MRLTIGPRGLGRTRLVPLAAATVALTAALAPAAGATAALGATAVAAVPGPPFPSVCGSLTTSGPTCFAVRLADPDGADPGDAGPAGYGPDDLRNAYELPATGGAGATIAIVAALDDPRAESDLAQYRRQFGLPSCTSGNGCFRKVDQRGGTHYPDPDGGWASEIAVELDMVSAIAPLAHIILVEADFSSFDDLGAAVDQAVALGAGYISNGYGDAEFPTESAELDHFYHHPGVTIVAAAGNGDHGVQYPAASPGVTAVGGTSLIRAANPRGWSETAWPHDSGTTGSGCSEFAVKPAWQKDRGCGTRTVADVSAVADPATGVAVYDSYGYETTGWSVYGGSSVAASIITGVYALAGRPVAGTFPAAYPYAPSASAALNDITSGANGTCAPAYLCTAGVGFDGPTGLGTPRGLAAFRAGPHSELIGSVVDVKTDTGIPGAAVSVGPYPTHTDALGRYDIVVPPGRYAVSMSAYGYATDGPPDIDLPAGRTMTYQGVLYPLPRSTIRGTVTDGSGHGWPLYARITVDGVPGVVYTDPATGNYNVSLPQRGTYQLHITAVYNGYTEQKVSVALGVTNRVVDVKVPVDAFACTVAGYAAHNVGTIERFDRNTAPPGWSVANGTANGGWHFTDEANLTGGQAGYAIAASPHIEGRHRVDTTLTLPAADFSSVKFPLLSFDTYLENLEQTDSVELSVDGGTTWTVPWSIRDYGRLLGEHVDLLLAKAAGKPNVRVRFHYLSPSSGGSWELDNVLIGARTCDPVPGGLLLGSTGDANTHAAVNGVTVASTAVSTTSAATPDDPNLDDGFYWLFSPTTAASQFTAS